MKFFIDTANLEEIVKANELGLLDGVTTNPTLVSKENRKFEDLIKEKKKVYIMKGVYLSPGCSIPNLNPIGLVTHRNDILPIRTEGNRKNPFAMSNQFHHFIATGCIPDLYLSRSITRDNSSAVRTECNADNSVPIRLRECD